MALANVELTNTFDEWRVRTNQIIVLVDQLEGQNTISFFSNSANSLAVYGTGNINSNVYFVISTSNNTDDTAQANIASANLVNVVLEVARSAYGAANVTTGSLAFDKANTANITADKASANSAAAYNSSNTNYTFSANTVRLIANTAYAKANSANITAESAYNAGNTNYTFAANNVRLIANTAYAKANSANITADNAWTGVGSSFNKANSANIVAVSAFARANVSPSSGAANTYEVRLGISTSHSVTPESIWGDCSVLTDGATIAVDLSKGFDFSGSGNAPLSLGGNRILGAPSNVKNGQKGVLWFSATGSARTLTLNSSWKLIDDVEAGPYSISVSALLGVAYVTRGTTVYVTGILRRSTT